jgi:REP element-mobilizing transposase RayT
MKKFEVTKQYHLYARGVDKREIFLSEHDYLRFMVLLHTCNNEEKVKIGVVNKRTMYTFLNTQVKPIIQIDQYCLMPNHFHILCTEIREGGISKFMQKVLSGYTGYFNKKYRREGALLSSTYKAKVIHDDLYAQYIQKYIFYNPLKLIKTDYDSKNILLYEKERLNSEELLFLQEYPYRFNRENFSVKPRFL